MSTQKEIIENAWNNKENLVEGSYHDDLVSAIEQTILDLDSGELRVAYKDLDSNSWVVNEWAKKAVLLSFKINSN